MTRHQHRLRLRRHYQRMRENNRWRKVEAWDRDEDLCRFARVILALSPDSELSEEQRECWLEEARSAA